MCSTEKVSTFSSFSESRKRKPKDWADNDYYDSDDDTFLDRTGDIEKKREKRIKKSKTNKDSALTYDELVSVHIFIKRGKKKQQTLLHGVSFIT